MSRADAIRRVRALREIRVDRGATPAEEDAALAAIERIATRYDLRSEEISPRAPVPQADPYARPPGWVGRWPPPFAWPTAAQTTAFYGGNGNVTIIINW